MTNYYFNRDVRYRRGSDARSATKSTISKNSEQSFSTSRSFTNLQNAWQVQELSCEMQKSINTSWERGAGCMCMWTILRSFPVFELILYLQGGHEYSSKHSSSLFNKRYLCQHTRHSCFDCSIRVEMNRQQLLGVAREVQSFSSPSLNNR